MKRVRIRENTPGVWASPYVNFSESFRFNTEDVVAFRNDADCDAWMSELPFVLEETTQAEPTKTFGEAPVEEVTFVTPKRRRGRPRKEKS